MAFLLTVRRIIRGIEIKNQLIRRLMIGGDELLKQYLVQINGNLTIHSALQTTKSSTGYPVPLLVRSRPDGLD